MVFKNIPPLCNLINNHNNQIICVRIECVKGNDVGLHGCESVLLQLDTHNNSVDRLLYNCI